MSLTPIVACADGLMVAQRGATLGPGQRGWHVAERADVARPHVRGAQAQRADDLVVWRRLWAEQHRLVIEYVGQTWVEVNDVSGAVVFESELDPEMEQHLLLDHVLPLVLARRGHLVLHGAVVSNAGAGVVLLGMSGAGKSTLAAYLWSKGWSVGGDDGGVVSFAGHPCVEPTYSTVRLTTDAAALLNLEAGDTSPVVGKRRLKAEVDSFHRTPVPLTIIAFIEPVDAEEPASFAPMGAGASVSRLIGSVFHAGAPLLQTMGPLMKELASLVELTAVGVLRVPRGRDGLDSTRGALVTALGDRVGMPDRIHE